MKILEYRGQCIYLNIYLLLAAAVEGKCPSGSVARLPFVLEYALWRGWQQALIHPPDVGPGCEWARVRLVKCLSVNGIASAASTAEVSRVSSRLGVVVLSTSAGRNATMPLTNLVNKLHQLQMNTASYDWLMVASSVRDFSNINIILNATSVRFDQNLVVAYPSYNNHSEKILSGLCDTNFEYKKDRKQSKKHCNNRRDCSLKNNNEKVDFEKSYYRSSERFKYLSKNNSYLSQGKVLPLYNSGFVNYNYTRNFHMTNISKFSLTLNIKKWQRSNNAAQHSGRFRVHVLQYLKVRLNSTLYARFLGSWSAESSMSGVEMPCPVEGRGFLGEELVVGRVNASAGATSLDDDGAGATSPAFLDDVIHFLAIRLNATAISRYYSTLGLRTYEGGWSGLLGALVERRVDVAVEPASARDSRTLDMDFIFPIAETMHQETSAVRDIFLAPFSARLAASVAGVVLAAAGAVLLVARLAPAPARRRMACAEALLWSTAILCQQGGTWTPPQHAASVLLVVCLLFSVVTYNAYAAFITSVLSVRVASVGTVAAVLREPDLQIGYIRNGADQMYLMSTKDVQLNAFYIRGYSNTDNLVSSAEEGLARAASQEYAFFAGQRAARTTLRSLSQARGRCAVREVPVHSTRAHLAFPLPRHSPYARPMLLSLLQLRGAGSLARLEAALVPEMPHCAPPPGFASAKAADVRSALLLLVTGYITALFLGLVEFCWKNRKELRTFTSKCTSRCLNIVKQI